jgi:hypothetical protein
VFLTSPLGSSGWGVVSPRCRGWPRYVESLWWACTTALSAAGLVFTNQWVLAIVAFIVVTIVGAVMLPQSDRPIPTGAMTYVRSSKFSVLGESPEVADNDHERFAESAVVRQPHSAVWPGPSS